MFIPKAFTKKKLCAYFVYIPVVILVFEKYNYEYCWKLYFIEIYKLKCENDFCQNITFWRSLFPVRPRPSYPQRPLGSDQSPPRDVHRPETDVWLGIPTKNIGGRFLARDFVVRTGDGGMGWGGRSGSRQRAGGIQGHCPPVTAKKGFSNVFREIDQTFNCYSVLFWHLCPFGDILWEHYSSPVRTWIKKE